MPFAGVGVGERGEVGGGEVGLGDANEGFPAMFEVGLRVGAVRGDIGEVEEWDASGGVRRVCRPRAAWVGARWWGRS